MKYFKICITVTEGDDSIIPGSLGDPNDCMAKPSLWFRLDNPHGSAGIGIICTDSYEYLEEAIKVHIEDVYVYLVKRIKENKEILI